MTYNDLRSLLPQRGTMCLLDAVVDWDASHIICHSERHRAPDNPLKNGERLSSIHGIEFAAQAMAAHRGLVAGSAPAPSVGLLLSVRDCHFWAPRLDDIAESLSIKASVVGSSGNAQTYQFEVLAGERRLLEGRASVMLQRVFAP
ncbi:MAG: hydroxymyristoyl-ACP dehydratase [Casimicrobiaceae bacterium]